MQITLTTSLSAVLAQVAQSSAYAGGKRQETPKADDPEALDRIGTIDEDGSELTHFFNEARIPLAAAFAKRLSFEGLVLEGEGAGDTYNLVLDVQDDFNMALLPALNYSLFDYFVKSILAAWYVYTHREDVENYAGLSMALLDQIKDATMRRTFTRKLSPFNS